MTNKGIADFSGLEYFTGFQIIDVSSNPITNFPLLGSSVTHISFANCQLTTLPPIPPNLQSLNLTNNSISSIPALPATLTNLIVSQNPITALPPLPSGLINLKMDWTGLPTLPPLPNTLEQLDASNLPLGSISSLPPNLTTFTCAFCQLNSLPPLPNSLTYINLNQNPLSSLPGSLPPGLTLLNCSNTNISSLPTLPPTIESLYLTDMPLTALPNLPDSLYALYLDRSSVSLLPPVPNGVDRMYLTSNNLQSLPPLPPSLRILNADSNQISCIAPFPNSPIVLSVNLADNPLACIPNLPDNLSPILPLCIAGDPINNPAGCSGAEGIGGKVFADANSNCQYNTGEPVLHSVPLRMYDNLGNLVLTTLSHPNGQFFLDAAAGTWKAEIDTLNKPFTVNCPQPGIDSTVTLTPSLPLVQGIDFEAICKPGFDIGSQSIVTNGILFPGQPVTIEVSAGDLSQFYGLTCASGTSGQVILTVNGPLNFNGIPNGGLTPTVAGNTFSYSIADFGTIGFNNSFQLNFLTQTTAQAGDSVCVDVQVTPTIGDQVPGNNVLANCFLVQNSYDPNMKEVYPSSVLPGYDGWLTYTIHFQNTGNAPAFNIRLEDTLTADLNLSSFEFLNASHAQSHVLRGNHLTVHFPNIMLPDSLSDPQGSQGFFQFRIKPRSGMTEGSSIQNRAGIYFDYNAPVITNYAETAFETPTSIAPAQTLGVSVYPNPGQGTYQVGLPFGLDRVDYCVTDLYGRMLVRGDAQQSFPLDLAQYPAGIYLLQLSHGDSRQTLRIVQQ